MKYLRAHALSGADVRLMCDPDGLCSLRPL